MEGFKEKTVVFSLQYIIDMDNIYNYGIEVFGGNQAQKYEAMIEKSQQNLL